MNSRNRIITLVIVVLATLTLGNTGCDPDEVAIGDELEVIEQAYGSDFPLTDHNAIHRLDLVVQLQTRLIEDQAQQITALETLFDRIAALEALADQFPEYAALAQTVEDNEWTVFSTRRDTNTLFRCLQMATWTTQCRDDTGLYPTHFDPTL